MKGLRLELIAWVGAVFILGAAMNANSFPWVLGLLVPYGIAFWRIWALTFLIASRAVKDSEGLV